MSPADPRVWKERQSDRDFAAFLASCNAPDTSSHPALAERTDLCPPEHQHGAKTTCYATHGCRCAECRTAKRAYQRDARADGPRLVSALGTVRRVQALVALGWSVRQVSAHGDVGYAVIAKLLQRGSLRTHPATAVEVARIFDDLWDQRPAPTTGDERVSVARALNHARRLGFAPPMAWDDIDRDEAPSLSGEDVGIDEIAVELATQGIEVSLTPEERREAVQILHARRMNDYEIAARVHCSDRTVLRIRQELGLPEVFGQTEWRPRPSEGRAAA